MLGGLLAQPELLDEVRPILNGHSAFFKAQHENLYRELIRRDRAGRRAGVHQIVDDLRRDNRLDDVGGSAYLIQLAANAPAHDVAIERAHEVADKARLRTLIDTASEILSDAYRSGDGYTVVLARARSRLEQLS